MVMLSIGGELLLLNKDGVEMKNEDLYPLVVKEDKTANFLLWISKKNSHNITVEVYEVNGWVEKFRDSRYVLEPSDIDLYLTAYIKWDGCSHVWFGDVGENNKQDGYLHLCGRWCWDKHIQLMSELWDFASKNIEYWDDDAA